METHYANTTRAFNHTCPRCEGTGVTSPVASRTLPCARCFGTGEDLLGTLATWEADLQDLRTEWKHYNSLMQAAVGGRRLGLSKKVDALAKRGVELKAHIDALRAEIANHMAPAPF